MNTRTYFYPIFSIEHNCGYGLVRDRSFDVAIIAGFHVLRL